MNTVSEYNLPRRRASRSRHRKPRPRLDDTWFTRSRRSARAHAILEFARKLPVPRARIELATHGSSGHVPGDSRNRAGTQARPHMVMTNDKWFNEKDGEQASAHVR